MTRQSTSHFTPVALNHASRLINHGPTVLVTSFAEVVAAAADARIFANGRWDFRDDNTELQTIHHLGAGKFVRAGGVVQGVA